MGFLQRIIDRIEHHVQISEIIDSIDYVSEAIAKTQKTLGAFGKQLKDLTQRINDCIERLETIEETLDNLGEEAERYQELQDKED